MAGRKQSITLGIALAVVVFAAIISKIWIEMPLLLIALLLFVWGLEPEGTEEFVGRLPYAGDYILKALAKLNSVLSRWN